MNEFLNLQAAFSGTASVQTAIAGSVSGPNASDGEGFGAVLGAVMADSMSGSGGTVGTDAADGSSGLAAAAAQVTGSYAADGNPVGNAAVGEAVSAADNAEKALAEFYGALSGVSGGELPEVMFTSEGAKAFISVLERYISQGNVPSEDLEKLWKDVGTDEKQAYADILGAIAMGSAVLPDSEGGELEASAEDMLEFVIVEAAKTAAKPAVSRKSVKDEEEAAVYMMSVFIAPVFSADVTEDQSGIRAVDADGEAAAYGENSAGIANRAEFAEMAEEDIAAFAEEIVQTLFEGDPVYAEQALDFFGEVSAELKGQIIAQTDEAAEKISPEDIGRHAFMARVAGAAEEMPVFGVEAALRRMTEASDVSEVPDAADTVEAVEMTDLGAESDNADLSGEYGGFDSDGDFTASEAANGGTASAEITDKAQNTENTENTQNTENAENTGNTENVGGVGNTEISEKYRGNADDPKNAAGLIQSGGAANVREAGVYEASEAAYAEDKGIPVSPSNTEEIARRISETVLRGRSESIVLRLDPAELGEIKITVSRKAGETSVAFEAHKSESAQLIGDRAAALAESLASKGITVREITVTDMSYDRNGRNGSGGFYRDGSGGGNNRSNENSDAGHSGYSRRFCFEQPEETEAADENYYYEREANLWLSI